VRIGAKLGGDDARDALRSGVTAVLDLSAEFSETKAFREMVYRNIPILDLTAPTSRQLEEMSEFIDRQSRRGVVYVHCKIGYSRSAAAIAAYLIKSDRVGGAREAFAAIRRKRPSIVIRPEIVSALSKFDQEHRRDPDTFLLVSAQTVPS
jgi:protein-tyrosine phosphatase